jgi:hypothetical protein
MEAGPSLFKLERKSEEMILVLAEAAKNINIAMESKFRLIF